MLWLPGTKEYIVYSACQTCQCHSKSPGSGLRFEDSPEMILQQSVSYNPTAVTLRSSARAQCQGSLATVMMHATRSVV